MSWLDSIPTLGEIFEWTMCRLADHDWVEGTDGVERCSACEKTRKKAR